MRGALQLEITAFCRVYPLERPRFSTLGRVFQPKSKQQALHLELAHYAKCLTRPLEGPLVVDMTVYFKRRAGKLPYPTSPMYGDEDNLRKAVNDGLVAYEVIVDDRHIIGGETWKLFSTEDSVEIQIYEALERQ